MSFTMPYFAEVLRVERTRRKWSQKELARRSGLSRSMIIKYENEECVPAFDSVCKLADALNIRTDDFWKPHAA